MTLKEAAELLHYSEQTLYKNFKRTQKKLEKEGIILTKDRFGYYVKLPPKEDDLNE